MSTLEQVKPAPPRTTDRGTDERGGWLATSKSFLTEVRNEMRRVTWPSRKEVYATTIVVIATSSFFGLYLWGLDLALSAIISWIFRAFGA